MQKVYNSIERFIIELTQIQSVYDFFGTLPIQTMSSLFFLLFPYSFSPFRLLRRQNLFILINEYTEPITQLRKKNTSFKCGKN